MTVYSRKTADGVKWRYDFMLAGERCTSPISYESKREAASAEKERRKASSIGPGQVVSRKARLEQSAITLGAACDQFWADVARHHRSAHDVERRMGIIKRLIGADTPITAIRFATVNEAIQTRRGEISRRNKPLSPGTVNLDVIDALRPVLNHASEVFEVALPRIAWKKLRLKIAGKIVREYADDEIAAWVRELGSESIEATFLALALRYGPRFGEMFFPPDAFKGAAAAGPELHLGRYLSQQGVWRDSRKDGSMHVLALLEEDAAVLQGLIDRALAVGAAHCWIEQDGAPISYCAMRSRLLAASRRAGIEQGRVVHGMRHHAGTQIARRTGSLLLAKELLGHRQITTTERYAHASKADMREGLRASTAPGKVGGKSAKSPARFTTTVNARAR